LTCYGLLSTLLPSHQCARDQVAGFFMSGVVSMDITAEHFTDDGRPLLPACKVAAMAGVQTRTVYKWESRHFLSPRGLDENGRKLYDAGEAAMVASSPRRRNAA
jgi:hypothetical protein